MYINDVHIICYVVFGILGAIVGANLAIYADVQVLRKYFGIFLCFIIIYEIYSIIKEYKISKNEKNIK